MTAGALQRPRFFVSQATARGANDEVEFAVIESFWKVDAAPEERKVCSMNSTWVTASSTEQQLEVRDE
jgi:hypothetical protein